MNFGLFFLCSSFAQEGIRSTKNTPTRQTSGKIMLIPFEPRLYMSEIDQKVNQQTNWKFNQIRENFRRQLDVQLKVRLNHIASVVSFYSDSIKTSKDLAFIYKSISLSYDPVEKPSAVTAPSVKQQSGISKGQVVVEMNNNDNRFMNVKLVNLDLLNYLHKKYKSEYFVFINELDIKTDPNSYNALTDSYECATSVHYTILDQTAKIISAGLAVSKFSSKEGNPKKIVALSFAPIATDIANKLSTVIVPPKTVTPKK